VATKSSRASKLPHGRRNHPKQRLYWQKVMMMPNEMGPENLPDSRTKYEERCAGSGLPRIARCEEPPHRMHQYTHTPKPASLARTLLTSCLSLSLSRRQNPFLKNTKVLVDSRHLNKKRRFIPLSTVCMDLRPQS
jgi:hypothetical protein